jgi:hypothetical protein
MSSADEWMEIVHNETKNNWFDLERSAPLWNVVFIRGQAAATLMM